MVVVIACCGLLVAACERRDASDGSSTASTTSATNAAEAAEDVGSVAPDDDPVLLEFDGLTIRLSDYERGLAMGGLLGQELSAETLASPTFQRSHILRTAKRLLIRREAAARGLVVTPQVKRDAIRERPGLEAWADLEGEALDQALRDAGIERETFDTLAEELALKELLTDALLAEIDDDALWRRYEASHTRLALDVVRLLNVPSSEEISSVVRRELPAIEAYYAKHRGLYVTPERVVVRRFLAALDRDADEGAVVAARRRVEEYRRRALSEPLEELIVRGSDGPEASKGGMTPPVTRSQLPQAFELEVGQLSEVTRGPYGFFFYRVEERLPERVRELNKGLQREIASRIIQDRGAAPSVARAAEEVRDALAADDLEAVRSILDEHRGDLYEVEPFPLDGSHRIPGIGRLPRVLDVAETLTSKNPVAAQPILEGEYLWVVRLRSREDADRLRFTAEKDAFREAVLARERPRAVEALIARQLPNRGAMNLRAVQRRHGVLRKDGGISKVD